MDRLHSYHGDEPYIFVCYSHEDTDLIDSELTWLNEQGFRVYFDEGIQPGEEWTNELASAISSASSFLLFVTPDSVSSRYCRDEVNYAKSMDKPFTVVHLKPTKLGQGLELSLGLTQAIFRFDISDESYRRKLIGSLDVRKATAPAAPTKQKNRELSVAVLPFVNMSSDQENEYFSDGITEEILDTLVKTNAIPVIARTSSFMFKGQNVEVQRIAEQLNVTHVLEGSVRKSGNRVTITAQLIDAGSGTHVWSDKYDRELIDVFAIQDEIALAIVDEIQAHLGESAKDNVNAAARLLVNMEAYDLYLQAENQQAMWNPTSLAESLRLYNLALELDPGFTDAWIGLCFSHIYSAHPWISGQKPVNAYRNAKQAAITVLAIDPENSFALFFKGLGIAFADHRWTEGFRLMEQALLLHSQHAGLLALYGSALFWLQQPRAAVFMEKAYRLDPLSPIAATFHAIHHMYTGRQKDAFAIMEPLAPGKSATYLARIAFAAFSFTVQKFDEGERYLSDAMAMVGADHPAIMVYQQQLAMARGETTRVREIGCELVSRSEHEYIPYLGRTVWDEDALKLVFHRVIDQGQLYFIISSLLSTKPEEFTDTEWQALHDRINLDEFATTRERGANRLRSSAEKSAILARAMSLDDKVLEQYEASYQALFHGKLYFTLNNQRLWVQHSIYDIQGPVVATGENHFEFVDQAVSCKFERDDEGRVIACSCHDGQGTINYQRTHIR